MIRVATVEDAEGIARVKNRGWQEAYAHVLPADVLAGLEIEPEAAWWRRSITSDYVVLVAEREGKVAGFASGGASRDDDAPDLGELLTIYVDPDVWGQGIGRALISELEAGLSRRGYAEALLWVLEDNPRARRFYERAGWAYDGTQRMIAPFGHEISEVRYRKKL